jgi:hypothetical protein
LPVYQEMTGKMPVPPLLPEICHRVHKKEHLVAVMSRYI